MTTENEQIVRERKKSQPAEVESQTPGKVKDVQPPTEESESIEDREPVFGPMPTFPNQRFWTRMLLILGTLVVVYFTSGNEKTIPLAKQIDKLNHRRQEVLCSKEFSKEVTQLLGVAKVRCGRVIMDSVITSLEAKQLLEIAKKGLQFTGTPAGGASILDLHSEALNAGDFFFNFYSLNLSTTVFTKDDFDLYSRLKRRVQETVGFSFDVYSDQLFLTKPTFFSCRTAKEPATPHNEYWQSHIDKKTYQSFHYTSLIYLNDFGKDFEGGRLIFEDPENVTSIIEPKTARLVMFSSGKENFHRVERVTKGERYAITISFTCDVRKAIADPLMNKIQHRG